MGKEHHLWISLKLLKREKNYIEINKWEAKRKYLTLIWYRKKDSD